jgi:hypothetical protein
MTADPFQLLTPQNESVVGRSRGWVQEQARRAPLRSSLWHPLTGTLTRIYPLCRLVTDSFPTENGVASIFTIKNKDSNLR